MKKVIMVMTALIIAGQLMAQTNKKIAPPPPPPVPHVEVSQGYTPPAQPSPPTPPNEINQLAPPPPIPPVPPAAPKPPKPNKEKVNFVAPKIIKDKEI